MKNFLYSLFIGLFGIAALTSIAFLLMYAAQSKQQAHLLQRPCRRKETGHTTGNGFGTRETGIIPKLILGKHRYGRLDSYRGHNIDYPVMQTPTEPHLLPEARLCKRTTPTTAAPLCRQIAMRKPLGQPDHLRSQHEGRLDVRRPCQVPQQGFLASTQNRLVRYGAGQQRL